MPSTSPLAGGPIIMISFARITIPPGGSSRTYFISYSWWIIGVSEVGPLIETPYHCYLKHVCGTPFITKNIWSTMLNSLYQLSKHRCMGNVMKFFSPYLKWFSTYYHVMDIICLSLGRIYPWKMCLNTFFLSIDLVKSDNHIFLSIVWFNLSCDLWDLSSNILLLL